MVDNGYIDMREFLSRMVEEIVLEYEVMYSGDTDEGSIEHLSLTMIMQTVVQEIIDGASLDFMNTFLGIVKVHFQEVLDSGRLDRTHEDDPDSADETCVNLRPDPELDVRIHWWIVETHNFSPIHTHTRTPSDFLGS